jgi:hypothetical protein
VGRASLFARVQPSWRQPGEQGNATNAGCMLRVWIGLGRLSVLAGALLTTISGTIYGWFIGMDRDIGQYAFDQPGAVTPNRIAFGLLGLVCGLIIAGSVFGLAAAIFDMQNALRHIANRGEEPSDEDRWREADARRRGRSSEPRLSEY